MQVSSLFFICLLLVVGCFVGLASVASMNQAPVVDTFGTTSSPATNQSAEFVATVATTESSSSGVFLVFVAAATVLVIALGAFAVMRKQGYGKQKYRSG